MRQAIGVGMVMFEGIIKSNVQVITAQAKKSPEISTLSLTDDRTGCMIIIKLNPEVKKLLKELTE